jgi:hypothetical protein
MRSSFVHPALGALTFDEEAQGFDGFALIGSERIPVHVAMSACADDERFFTALENQVANLPRIVESARQYAAASLHEQINAQWLNPSERALSFAELVARLAPSSITFYPESELEIFLGPEHLFSGHSIIVSGDSNGTFTEASVAG